MAHDFAVTFDYLCPFARNAHEAVVTALRDGADLQVRFVPFSLNQAHTEEGEQALWDRDPEAWPGGVTALVYGLAVRDAFPDQFLAFHIAAFAQRHDHGHKFDAAVLDETARTVGIDLDALKAEIATGRPAKTLAVEHTEAVERWAVFGVPTFIDRDEAVFIRFMERGRVHDLHQALDLLAWTRLNEFKRTRIPR
jgi:predicted DsbA family dithiol-disulfide isomerase